jgi:hypothetical protein
MTMPKASMHEDDSTMARKNYIWRTGEMTLMQSEPKSQPVEHSPNNQFGTCVAAFHLAHGKTTLLDGEVVRHSCA